MEKRSLCLTCTAPLCEWLLRGMKLRGMKVRQEWRSLDRSYAYRKQKVYIVETCPLYKKGDQGK